MCYGARSAAYNKNHDDFSFLSQDDLKSSFAYKLFYAMHNNGYNLHITARTGVMKRDNEHAEVASEEDVKQWVELQKYYDRIAYLEDNKSNILDKIRGYWALKDNCKFASLEAILYKNLSAKIGTFTYTSIEGQILIYSKYNKRELFRSSCYTYNEEDRHKLTNESIKFKSGIT